MPLAFHLDERDWREKRRVCCEIDAAVSLLLARRETISCRNDVRVLYRFLNKENDVKRFPLRRSTLFLTFVRRQGEQIDFIAVTRITECFPMIINI